MGQRTKRTTTVTVDLGELKAPWQVWCQQQGGTPSHALRNAIRQAMDRRAARTPAPRLRVTPKRERATARIELNLTTSELAALKRMAGQEGYVPTKWMVAMVRTKLTGRAACRTAGTGDLGPVESATPRLGQEPEPDCESPEYRASEQSSLSGRGHHRTLSRDPGPYEEGVRCLTRDRGALAPSMTSPTSQIDEKLDEWGSRLFNVSTETLPRPRRSKRMFV